MFGNKKSADIPAQVETLIGQSTSVKGSLSSEGSMRIDGKFEGDIVTTADIIVGENAVVTATVTAKNAVVAGSVTGNGLNRTQNFDVAFYVKGDQKPVTLYSAELVMSSPVI